MKLTTVSLLLSASLLFVGCVSAPTNPKIREVPERVQNTVEQINQNAARLGERPATPIERVQGSYVPMRRVEKIDPTSLRYKADNQPFEAREEFRNLPAIVNAIAMRSGIPVALAPDVPMMPTLQAGLPGAMPTGAAGLMPGAPMPMPSPIPTATPAFGAPGFGTPGIPGMGGAQQSAQITGASPYQAKYAGNVSGFMDVVAAYYGLSWRAEANTLRFFYLDSRTFRIKAVPGEVDLSSTVSASTGATTTAAGGSTSGTSGAGTTGSSSGIGNQSANTSAVKVSGLSVWNGIRSGITQYLTPGVGRVDVSAATGTVTVTDTPAKLDRIAAFIDMQNASLRRQVAINVRVLSVSLNDTDEYGINWDVVYRSMSDMPGFALKTAFPVSQTAGSAVFSINDPTGASKWNGSRMLINALSSQGRVTELTSAGVVTLNNQPAPVNVGRQTSYIAGSSTTTTASVGSTTSLIPGTVDTGFAMVLVPHILDGNEMMLQASINLSSLLDLKTVTSGTSSAQTPEVSASNFIQRVFMNSGETLVVAGFDQENLSAVASGIGRADNPVLGGRTGFNRRNMLVVLIQPVIASL